MSQHTKPFACGRCTDCESGDYQNCRAPRGGCRCAECIGPDPVRDCAHGRKRGKCSDCDVVELEQRAEKAEALVAELDLAVRVALAFTRPCVEGAMHLLDAERVETAADLTNYLRVVLAKVGE